MPEIRACSIKGCAGLTDMKGTARGWCSAHYQRWQRWGDPLYVPPLKNKGRTCAADGCSRPAVSRGYCGTHVSRIHRNGTIDEVRPHALAPEGMRWCARCRTYRSLTDFGSNRSRPDGLTTECRSCSAKRAADWRRRNPEKYREQVLSRDRVLGAERQREWRREHPDKARAQSSARRARRRNAPVVEVFTSEEIARRDRWICGICDEPISKTARWPEPTSLSIDHIVPLAAGGEHSRANAQATHLRCNLKKHTGGCDQLRLIG